MRPLESLRTLDDWLSWMPGLTSTEINLGLERVAVVLERLDLPRPPRVLTIAGTNGKGSSVAMLEALFGALPGSVGAYTSPHILRYTERIRVDGEEASEAQIVAAFEHIESVREEIPLTYFEYGTLAALVVFAQAGVTTALLEVGLGGRLDAVNAIDPDGCLITNISMDHTDWLGDSLEAIAREKAGIMRAGVPVIYGSREMPAAIANAAERTGARLSSAGCDFSWSCDETGEGSWHWHGQRHTLRDLARLPLNGAHQLGNAAAVLALMEAVGVDTVLETGKVNAAFSTLVLAGRQQRIDAHERTWLLDGAHNAAGALSLASAVAGLAGDRRVLSVIGILNDKDASAIVASLAGVSDRFIALSPASTRALPAARLGAIMEEIGQIPVRVVSDPDAAMVAAVSDSRPGDLIVVAGSFYTLESALRWLAADGD